MQIRKTLLIVIGLLFFTGLAQEKRYDFTAFGYLPKVVSNDYFLKLNNAQTKEIRFQYLDTISLIYLRSGHADSLMHYGKLLKEETLSDDLNSENTENFNLKAFYYQGVAAQKMGLLDEAIQSYIQGIEASTSNDFIHKYLKLQLAETYLYKGELEKAKAVLEELPQLKRQLDFYLKNGVVKSLFLIQNNDYDLAKNIINKALSENFVKDYPKLKLELELNLSKIQLRQENYSELIKSSNSIKNNALNESFYDLYIEASLQVGYAYARLKNYDVSEMALSSAYVNTIQYNGID
ncbi:hypothetical protein [uncultured Winogradskyella sp.]|uniref:hypothetical protein n=1 Tax=uncultured Winogradskyella sp. TaxID=395353 RepID=UPI002608BE6B|nr:hypothetical protein [uncultured Winogradskyella sp.]